MLGVIAFIIGMGLFIYFMYDGTLFKNKKTPIVETLPEKTTSVGDEHPLNVYLREHVYQHLTFEFQQLKDSKNGYYYEKDLFSLTVFDYSTHRTAQLFQVKPYRQIAVMHANKPSFEQVEVTFKDVPEAAKALVHSYFEKVKDMNLNNLHNTLVDEEIEMVYGRILTQIKKMDDEKDLLSLELKHKIKQLVHFDLPELMQRYQKLPMYDLQTGKMRIKEQLELMEKDLAKQWAQLLDEKRRAYERIVSLSK